jgi:hypothetical protein
LRTPRALGLKLLGVYLILTGLHLLLPTFIPGLSVLQGLLALVAGVLILLDR